MYANNKGRIMRVFAKCAKMNGNALCYSMNENEKRKENL